jgi:hypothetical protein
MSLEELSFVSQIASAIAVIASLIFVGYQLKHAAAAIRASSSEAHSAIYVDLIKSVVDNKDFALVWAVALHEPGKVKDADWVRFVAYTGAFFRFYESSWVQWQNSRLDAEHWATIERQAADFRRFAGVQRVWEMRDHWYSGGFRNWFESLATENTALPYARE